MHPRNNATLVSHTEEPTFVALQNRRSTNRNRKDRSEISSETSRSLGSVESRRFRSSRDVRVVRNCRTFKTAPNRKKNICSFVCVVCLCKRFFGFKYSAFSRAVSKSIAGSRERALKNVSESKHHYVNFI